MSLRLRLIVVFFLLSVVPVGAVTYYTYANNAQAIRDAAGFEAGLLAGELSQRMKTVTAQLGQRVESLMALETTPVASLTTSAPSAPTAPSVDAEQLAAVRQLEELEAVERALAAEFSAILTNITVSDRGLRRGGGRRGGPPPANGQGPPTGGRGPVVGPAPASPGAPPLPPAPPTSPGNVALTPGGPATSGTQASGSGQRNGSSGRGGGEGGTQNGRGGGAGQGRGAEADADPGRIRIDLAQLRREMFEELVPDREAFDALTPEQQKEIFERINQRMQGVQQGIDVLRKELESRTLAITEIRTQGATDGAEAALGTTTRTPAATAKPAAPTASQTGSAAAQAAAAATSGQAAPKPAPAPPAAPSAPGAPLAPAAPVTLRSTELSGGRLAVRVERDGQLVGEVGADVDLDMLLSSVFETTSRERGEVPFAVGQDGRLYTPTEADKGQLEALQTTALQPATEPGTTILPDWIVATTPDPTGSGLKFGIARPVGEALRDLQQTSARNAGLGVAFIGLALIAIVPLSGRLTRNLDLLGDGVNRIAQGDYAARVQVRSNDEVGRLARAFNLMAADVEKHHRSSVEQERIRRELELGRQIQHDMLPQTPLRLGLTEVKGVSVPAREVGGDFFNYFQLQDGSIALLVGDVSGKGVGAALLMANIQAALRTRLSLGQDLASLAQELDVDIDRTTPGPVYATLFVGILDPVSRHLRCVNAGHNPQYILRAERRLERMESTGRPIGLYSGGGYTEQHFNLAPGDVLFFYTDGCVEAENGAGEMFGAERLEAILSVSAGRDADAVIVEVESDVSRFRAGVELQDDATMMVVKVG